MNKNMSTLDCAYQFLKENGQAKNFFEIWNYVVETLEIANPDDKISTFYTNLTLDGRFINTGDNSWDLRTNQKYDKNRDDRVKGYYEEESSNVSKDSDDEIDSDDEESDEDDESYEESDY